MLSKNYCNNFFIDRQAHYPISLISSFQYRESKYLTWIFAFERVYCKKYFFGSRGRYKKNLLLHGVQVMGVHLKSSCGSITLYKHTRKCAHKYSCQLLHIAIIWQIGTNKIKGPLNYTHNIYFLCSFLTGKNISGLSHSVPWEYVQIF